MNDIQLSLLESFGLVANASVNSAQNTLTIEAVIDTLDDPGLNSYKVEYMDNKFIAHANSQNVQYSKGDKVYILIPNGDFNKDKVILGTVKPTGNVFTATSNEITYHLEKSDNLLKDIGNIHLCSYKSENREIDLSSLDLPYLLEQYTERYKTLMLSFKVKTNLPKEQQSKGNYGLKLGLYYDEYQLEDWGGAYDPSSKIREYTFDINKMVGNPYNFGTYTQQIFYITIDQNLATGTYDIPTLTAFVNGFTQDSEEHEDDIFIHDIELKVVDVLTEANKTGYYVSIAAERGEFFYKGEYNAKKKLTPILKLNGKDTSYSDLPCYWFVEDLSITPEHEYYSSRGGRGWRCLNDKTELPDTAEGEKNFQWVTNKYELEVTTQDVINTRRYKCVFVNTDYTLISGEITLRNLNSDYEIILKSANDSTEFVKNGGYVNLILRIYTNSYNPYTYTWGRYDKANNYIDNDFYSIVRLDEYEYDSDKGKEYVENEITFPASIIDELNTIKCEIKESYITDEGTYEEATIGIASLNLTSTLVSDYTIFIENGDKLYKYDANGNSPMVGNYAGPESTVVRTIAPLEYRIFKADGTELSESEYAFCRTTWYVPKNSLIKPSPDHNIYSEDENYYHIHEQHMRQYISLRYVIANTYNPTKNDNTVKLEVEFDDKILKAETDIKFLKEGQSGTNGTRYSAEIQSETQFVIWTNNNGYIYNDNQEHTVSPLGNMEVYAKVYKDGEDTENSSSVQWTVKWSMFDAYTTKPRLTINPAQYGKNGVLTLAEDWQNKNPCNNIVQAAITIQDGEEKEVIYAYYPIDSIVYHTDRELDVLGTLPYIKGGFKEVVYAADGTNPQYASPIFKCGEYFDLTDTLQYELDQGYYNFEWKITDNSNLYFDSYERYREVTIRPNSKYDNIYNVHAIQLDMELIEGWGTEQVQYKYEDAEDRYTRLKDDQQYAEEEIEWLTSTCYDIKPNDWSTWIDEAKYFLNKRATAADAIHAAEDHLAELFDLCEQDKDIVTPIFNYLTVIQNCSDKLTDALSSLYYFMDENGNWTVLTLEDNTIDLSFDQKQQLKEVLSHTKFTQLNNIISLYNADIRSYKLQCSLLMSKTESATAFWNFVNSIAVVLIDDYVLGEFGTSIFNLLFAPSAQMFTYNEIKYNFYNLLINNLSTMYDMTQWWDIQIASHYYNKIMNDKYIDELNAAEDLYYYWKNRYENLDLNKFTIYRPIVMLYNRYGMNNINGWDGNRIYTNEEEGYIYAPQMGAGHKENDNSFTGVIMGDRRIGATRDTGLFGYHKGVQSFFLNAQDGSATFGKSGDGQIQIKPGDKAIIEGGEYTNVKDTGTGMRIDLTTPEIRWGNQKFIVDKDGNLTATNGDFTGIIHAKAGGDIAGWQINENTLTGGNLTLSSSGTIYSGSHNGLDITSNGFYLSEHGLSIGSKFKVTKDGTLTATNGTFTGIITATSGEIQGNVKVSGNISSATGTIGGWLIGTDKLTSGNMTIDGSNGSIRGANWSITAGGLATFNNVTISNNNSATNGNTFNWGNGKFKIDKDGVVTATGANISGILTASSGSIIGSATDGWAITGTSIHTMKTISNGDPVMTINAGSNYNSTFIIAPNCFQIGGMTKYPDGSNTDMSIGAHFLKPVIIRDHCYIHGDAVADKLEVKSGRIGDFDITSYQTSEGKIIKGLSASVSASGGKKRGFEIKAGYEDTDILLNIFNGHNGASDTTFSVKANGVVKCGQLQATSLNLNGIYLTREELQALKELL